MTTKNSEHYPEFHVWQDDDEFGWWNYSLKNSDPVFGGYATKELAVQAATGDLYKRMAPATHRARLTHNS